MVVADEDACTGRLESGDFVGCTGQLIAAVAHPIRQWRHDTREFAIAVGLAEYGSGCGRVNVS
jgi:hypothetical protein